MTETACIPKGGFTIARQIYTSPIWLKDPLYLKAWLWIIGKANHKDIERNGFLYKRGEIVTTYHEIIKALSHRHNRSQIKPTLKKVRIILEWLVNEEMIRVEPLQENAPKTLNPQLAGRCRTGADTGASTGAYVGIKIIVVNYDTYQTLENYKGRHRGIGQDLQGHNNNNDYNNNESNNNYISKTPPFQKISEAFHEILPELPGIRAWSDARKAALKARWNSGITNGNGTPINSVQYWTELFHYVRQSSHLMGNNNRGWKANIDFIIRESSFLKLTEGQYH